MFRRSPFASPDYDDFVLGYGDVAGAQPYHPGLTPMPMDPLFLDLRTPPAARRPVNTDGYWYGGPGRPQPAADPHRASGARPRVLSDWAEPMAARRAPAAPQPEPHRQRRPESLHEPLLPHQAQQAAFRQPHSQQPYSRHPGGGHQPHLFHKRPLPEEQFAGVHRGREGPGTQTKSTPIFIPIQDADDWKRPASPHVSPATAPEGTTPTAGLLSSNPTTTVAVASTAPTREEPMRPVLSPEEAALVVQTWWRGARLSSQRAHLKKLAKAKAELQRLQAELAAISAELEAREKNPAQPEGDSSDADSKALNRRLVAANEYVMLTLLELDGVQSARPEIRQLRKELVAKAMALLERVDQLKAGSRL